MSSDPAQDFIRYIGKNGDLELVSESSIVWARGLSSDQKVALYVRIRDESQRLEMEWRSQFADQVGMLKDALPKMLE